MKPCHMSYNFKLFSDKGMSENMMFMLNCKIVLSLHMSLLSVVSKEIFDIPSSVFLPKVI